MNHIEYLDNLLQSYISERDNLLKCVYDNLATIDALNSSLNSAKITDQEMKFFSPHNKDSLSLKKEEEQQRQIEELNSLNLSYEERIKELDLKIAEFEGLTSDDTDVVISNINEFDYDLLSIISLIDNKYASYLSNFILKFTSRINNSLDIISSFLLQDPYRANLEIADLTKKSKEYSLYINRLSLFSSSYLDINSFDLFFTRIEELFPEINFSFDIFEVTYSDPKSNTFLFYIIRELFFNLLFNFKYQVFEFHMKQFIKSFDIVINTSVEVSDNYFEHTFLDFLFSSINATFNVSYPTDDESEIHVVVPFFVEVKDGN